MSAGAETIWFGKYRGCRMDEVPGDYRAWAVYSDDAQRFSWTAVLEARRATRKSAKEVVNHQPFRVLYGRKKWRKWCHQKGRQTHDKYGKKKWRAWYWEFLELEEQYSAWLVENQRPFRQRKGPERRPDIGDRCGPWDDNIDRDPEGTTYDVNDDFIDDSEQPGLEDDDDYAGDSEDLEEETDDSDVEGSISRELEDLQEDDDAEEEEDPEEEEEVDSSASDDPETTRATRLVPRVIEIPSSGKTRLAKDLFNDDDKNEDDRDSIASHETSGQSPYDSVNKVLPAKQGRKRGTPRDAGLGDRRLKRPAISVASTSEDEGYVSIGLDCSGTNAPDRNTRSNPAPIHTRPYGHTRNGVILSESDEEDSDDDLSMAAFRRKHLKPRNRLKGSKRKEVNKSTSMNT